jgi:predicted transposase/invertase (TIGR01784 family)
LVREYAKSMDRSAAIIRAIDDCIRGNVLKDFLERNASEVRNMLFAKWDWDVAKRVWQEEAEERGREEGVTIGMERGVLRTARQMKAKGLNVALIAEVTGLLEEEIERLDIFG